MWAALIDNTPDGGSDIPFSAGIAFPAERDDGVAAIGVSGVPMSAPRLDGESEADCKAQHWIASEEWVGHGLEGHGPLLLIGQLDPGRLDPRDCGGDQELLDLHGPWALVTAEAFAGIGVRQAELLENVLERGVKCWRLGDQSLGSGELAESGGIGGSDGISSVRVCPADVAVRRLRRMFRCRAVKVHGENCGLEVVVPVEVLLIIEGEATSDDADERVGDDDNAVTAGCGLLVVVAVVPLWVADRGPGLAGDESWRHGERMM